MPCSVCAFAIYITGHSVLHRPRQAAGGCHCAPPRRHARRSACAAAAAPAWPRCAAARNVVSTSAGVQREKPLAAAAQADKRTSAAPRLHFDQADGLRQQLGHAGGGTARTLLVAARRRERLRAGTHIASGGGMCMHAWQQAVRRALRVCAHAPRWARMAARRWPPWRRWREPRSGRP
jgi:hypothetical protein